jgi:hypothetical protein
MITGCFKVGLGYARPAPSFGHIPGAGTRAWLRRAATSGLVLDWTSGDPRFNHWNRGVRATGPAFATANRIGAAFVRTGAREAGGIIFADGVPREIPGTGYRSSNAATNIIRASAVMSTQTQTVTAVQHTLSFTGTGTITLTGASTAGPLVGTGVNNRVSLVFTPAAAGLTMTVSGDVRLAQLETGGVATDYVPNLSTTDPATAAGDSYALLAADLPSGRMLITGEIALATWQPPTAQRILTWFTPNMIIALASANSIAITGGTESITLSTLTAPARFAYLYEPGVAGRASANGASVVVSTGVGQATPTGTLAIAGNAGSTQLVDYLRFLSIAPAVGTITDADLQAISSRT